MNKSEYLEILSERISELPHSEYANIMEYYTEYFEEAGEEKEQDVIVELGNPELLAEKIIKEQGQPHNQVQQYSQRNDRYDYTMNHQGDMNQNNNQSSDKKGTGLSMGWKLVIAIVTCPIWIGLACGVVGIAVGIAGAAFGCFAGGVAAIVAGAALVTTSGAITMLMVGVGCIMLGIALCFLMLTAKIAEWIKRLCTWIFGNKTKIA